MGTVYLDTHCVVIVPGDPQVPVITLVVDGGYTVGVPTRERNEEPMVMAAIARATDFPHNSRYALSREMS